MKNLNFISVLLVFLFFLACGDDDTVDVADLPSQSWDMQLNGQDFSVPNTGLSAYYDFFDGDLVVAGVKSSSTEERIVLTFNVDNGAPFVDGQSLDVGEGSGHALLYYDSQGKKYSSLSLEGTGSFLVDQYIETESRNFLSGTANGVLFNEADSTSVTVSGFVAAKTF
jgi:hypothetical protein